MFSISRILTAWLCLRLRQVKFVVILIIIIIIIINDEHSKRIYFVTDSSQLQRRVTVFFVLGLLTYLLIMPEYSETEAASCASTGVAYRV